MSPVSDTLPTPSLTLADAPPSIRELVPIPNPVPRGLALFKLELSRAVSSIEWRVYSPSFVLIEGQRTDGPLPAGIQSVWLDSSNWPAGPLILQAQIPGHGRVGMARTMLSVRPF